MFNAAKPDPSQLPSTGRLLKSTGIAAVIAGALLVTVVMPAEYGVDPTGAGSILGLTEMGRIKMQLAQEAKADAAADLAAAQEAPAPAQSAEEQRLQQGQAQPGLLPAQTLDANPAPAASWTDTTTIRLAPDEGFEVKLVMEKGATARFDWSTGGPKVNYDTHGDAPGINYHGYEKGTGVDHKEGTLTAAFTGSHGWFWRNRTGEPVTITLRTAGDYTDLKQID